MCRFTLEMAAFMAVLEADLRALSTEARRRYPAVKDAAEHAILKVWMIPGFKFGCVCFFV